MGHQLIHPKTSPSWKSSGEVGLAGKLGQERRDLGVLLQVPQAAMAHRALFAAMASKIPKTSALEA